MARKLEGKIAVITGGSSGIGLASAKRFVEEGAHVFITGRRQSELEKAVADIGGSVTAVQGDIAKLDDLDRLYEIVKAEKGKIDVLVANAGFVEAVTSAQATPEHFDKTFGINARGQLFHSAESFSATQRRRVGRACIILHSAQGDPALCNVCRYQGCHAVVRALLGDGAEGPQHPG